MPFHFQITCYIYYDDVKLETRHIPTLDDLRTTTSLHTTTFSNADLKGKLNSNQLYSPEKLTWCYILPVAEVLGKHIF